MIALLAKFSAMPADRRALLAEAMAALAVAALVIAVLPFRRVAALAGARPAGAEPPPADRTRIVRAVRGSVRACARKAPWRAKCFEQGLAAMWMLRRRGIAATLHYGAARRPGGSLAAHVWVRAGMDDVVGCENSAEFTELARFPANG